MNAVARLVVPEFGIDGVPLSVSLWLVQEGDAVQEGDRVVELLAGGITIDLVAPASGRLARQLIEEDEQVSAGTVLAEFDRA
jgi:pyruvate/2-oxoglutarate dehydrogenase complex dihydrolipoamide acyltransferase (E2) component